MGYPRLLVISNNCFSKSSSNGRTLANLLEKWNKERIAQFYIESAEPDFDICENYYRVTDREVLKSFFGKGSSGGPVEKRKIKNDDNSSKNEFKKKIQRTSITMLLRNMAWNSGKWQTASFKNWIREFSPEVILLQVGDAPFMISIALSLSKNTGASIVVINTESYYFKDYDYFTKDKWYDKVFYPIFRKKLVKQYNQLMQRCKYVFYLCQPLREEYEKHFGSHPCEVLYTVTEVQAKKQEITLNGELKISYLGNLGVGRADALAEFGEALSEIGTEYHIDVYGKAPTEEIKKQLEQSKGIEYQGLVPYEEVKRINEKSDIVVHVENFSDFYRKDLQFAFSTKIADLLASGKCFVVYAPEEFACVKYLIQNKAAYVAVNKEELRNILNMIVKNPETRKRYVDNALQLCEKNHRLAVNEEKIISVVCDLVKK